MFVALKRAFGSSVLEHSQKPPAFYAFSDVFLDNKTARTFSRTPLELKDQTTPCRFGLQIINAEAYHRFLAVTRRIHSEPSQSIKEMTSKASAKGAKKALKSAVQHGDKKRNLRKKESCSAYVCRVLKQVHPDTGQS
uniref:Uncharacterized protein n=1 Tax=Parascaris univalens TaxID=6257 RepID=A0A915APR8_PARUN